MLFKKGDVTCSPSVEETTTVSKLQASGTFFFKVYVIYVSYFCPVCHSTELKESRKQTMLKTKLEFRL